MQNSDIYIHPGKNMQIKVALSPAEYQKKGERKKKKRKKKEKKGRSSIIPAEHLQNTVKVV